jgi:hypothetical protein
MKLTMNDDYRYDIDMSQANISLDEDNLFHKKELSSVKNFNKLLQGKTEFKSQDNSLYMLWIEFKIIVDGIENPSGISTTQADVWRISVGELVFEFPTHFLKWIYKHHERLEIKVGNNHKVTNHIGYGIFIPASNILNLYNDYKKSEDYRKIIMKILKR